jgi:hypothetical protein
MNIILYQKYSLVLDQVTESKILSVAPQRALIFHNQLIYRCRVTNTDDWYSK